MHAERDVLGTDVFPQLYERLLARSIHLEFVDLRWGVQTTSLPDEQAKHALVLKVCLSEIDRCRPFFVVLLGDRYGWIPPAERIAAAAAEVSLAIEPRDKSVTALEVEYGAFAVKHGGAEPLFYFREPLPDEHMSPEVRSRYTDAAVRPASYAQLQALKGRIERTYPDRVHRYTLDWDATRGCPTGLKTFAERVLGDLWQELSRDLPGAPAESADWRIQEAQALDAFIDERWRRAQGRADLLERVVARAVPVQEAVETSGQVPTIDLGSRATVIVAEAGLGKSTVFSCLVRILQRRTEVCVLAHSAGLSPRSTSVDSMLGRWCFELEHALGRADPAGADDDRRDVEKTFHSLLEIAATRIPVVLVVDALDGFEDTPRASYLKWLPTAEDWPRNVSLVATSRGGPASGILAARAADVVQLEPLGTEDAVLAADRICAEYHKTLPDAVKASVLVRRDGERTASGNPLWLTLVVNELLLLDADDFAGIRSAPGAPDERLEALLVRTVEQFPANVDAAYQTVFARIEASCGKQYVQHTLVLLAMARGGLREHDLRALVPGHDAATFAAVRRALRAHLSRRGRAGAWAFSHPVARAAAVQRYAPDEADRRRIHAELGRHLQTLAPDDPLRGEILQHLLEAHDPRPLAGYWRQSESREIGVQDLTAFLLRRGDPDEAVRFVVSFLTLGEGDHGDVLVCLQLEWLLWFMEHTRIADASTAIATALLHGAAAALERLDGRPHEEAPGGHNTGAGTHMRSDVARVLGRVYRNLAMLLETPDASIGLLERSGELSDRLAAHLKQRLDALPPGDPTHEQAEIFYHLAVKDRMLNHQRLALKLKQKGDLSGALQFIGQAIAIGKYFLKRFPRSLLAVKDAARNYRLIGDVLFEHGQFEGARTYFGEAVELAEQFLRTSDDAELKDLAVTCRLSGARARRRMRVAKEAMQYVAPAFAFLRESAAANPEDVPRQLWFLDANDEIADALVLGNAFEPAWQCYMNAVATCRRMLWLGQRPSAATRHIRRSLEQMAVIAEIVGDADSVRQCREVQAAIALDSADRPPRSGPPDGAPPGR